MIQDRIQQRLKLLSQRELCVLNTVFCNCAGGILGADRGIGDWPYTHGDGVCLWCSFLWTAGPETLYSERCPLPVLCHYTACTYSAGHYCGQPLHCCYSRATCKAHTLTHTQLVYHKNCFYGLGMKT